MLSVYELRTANFDAALEYCRQTYNILGYYIDSSGELRRDIEQIRKARARKEYSNDLEGALDNVLSQLY